MIKREHIMNTTKRIFRRKKDWKALIEEWLKSGKSADIFCKGKKITTSGFYTWRKRLYPAMATRQVKPKSPANLFVPVELATLEPVKGLVLTYPNGCQLQITNTIDTGVLQMLNQAMGI
jgi:hypothetical protein